MWNNGKSFKKKKKKKKRKSDSRACEFETTGKFTGTKSVGLMHGCVDAEL